jgi:putative phosphoesterase
MNKIGIISDIHGNYEALKAVLHQLDEMKVFNVYCLGDVVGYYPQINECCEELRKRKIFCLMGNHDWYLAGGGFCPRSKSVNDCLKLQRKTLKVENLNWIKQFGMQFEYNNLKMVHGGWTDPIDEYLWEPCEEYFMNISGTFFSSGHTHIQAIHNFNSKIYCNPGSVGQPRDGNPLAAFATFDGQFEIYRIKYDPTPVYRLMHNAGYDDYYYGGLATGSKNLCKLPIDHPFRDEISKK